MLEKTIEKKCVYKGRIFDVYQHRVTLPNQEVGQRDVVVHPGGVAAIVIQEDKLLLVKQYRKAVDRVTYEIPAGMLDKQNESLVDAIKRELSEETGLAAKKWQKVVSMAVSPGYATELTHIFEASDIYVPEKRLTQDADEFVEVVWLTRQEVERCMQNGKLCDAKTLYAVLYWDLKRREQCVNPE